MKKSLGLYIHIPFCERKCSYCSFLSFPLEKNEMTKYIDVLCEEIRDNGKVLSSEFYVDTVFIGGGTPSLMNHQEIARLMETVYESFEITMDAEITIESNPNSLDDIKLYTYLKNGINRLSMGVQSFDDDILNMLGRVHDKQRAINAFEMARKAGFKNINIDLMFAVPGQGQEQWLDTLREAISLSPEHISFYSLQIEEGTKFYKAYKNETLPFVSDEIMNEMYIKATDMLEKEYVHYEISNCAKEGYQCRHNMKYWTMKDYLGLGLGASGYVNGFRFKNPDDMNIWMQMVTEKNAGFDDVEIIEETVEEAMSVFCFTALRTKDGIDLNLFKKKFGQFFWDVYEDKKIFINTEEEKGNIVVDDNSIALTKKGFLVSNEIMCEFI